MPKFYRNFNAHSPYALRGQETPSTLIFAEGQTEAYFLEKWLASLNKDWNSIAVVCYKGHSQLAPLFKAICDEENFQHIQKIGFLADAEEGIASHRVASIEAVLRANNILDNTSPKQKAGVLMKIGTRQIIVQICPNNIDAGLIEDVVVNEIDTTIYQQTLENFKSQVQAIGQHRINSKTLVQAYLAILKPGRCGTGHGFNSGDLDVMHPAYDGIRTSFALII